MTAGETEKKSPTLTERVENVGKLVAPFYLLFVGLFGDRITKDDYLLIVPLAYLVLHGLALLWNHLISPKSLTKLHWLRKVSSQRGFWFAVLLAYLVVIGWGFWAWVDRQILNQPPVIELLRPQATLLRPGEEIELQVWASDPENRRLRFYWSVSDGEVYSESYYSTEATYRAPTSLGQQEITVTVVDAKGKQASRTISVDVWR